MSDDATSTESTAPRPAKVKLDHDRGYSGGGVHQSSAKQKLYDELHKAAKNTAKLKRST